MKSNTLILSNFQIKTSSFEQLSKQELYAILALRVEVFCVEQDCPYQDVDGVDFVCQHFTVFHESELAAYARVIPPDTSICYIGRIVVAKKYRGQKLATKLIETCINYCKNNYSNNIIEISAQSYLTDYYQSLGFKSTGKFYLEDDIPHEQMQILAN